MDFLLEIFLTAVFAGLFSFLVAKIVSVAMAASGGGLKSLDSNKKFGSDVKEDVIMEALLFRHKMDVRGSESEERVGFDEETVGNVHRLGAEAFRIDEVGVSKETRAECEKLAFEGVEREESEEYSTERQDLAVKGEEREEFDEIRTECEEFAVEGVKREESEEIRAESQELAFQGEELESSGVKWRDTFKLEMGVEREGKSRDTIEESNDRVESEVSGDQGGHNDVVVGKSKEFTVSESEGANARSEDKNIEELDIEDDEDDWEGIERSELEKAFAAAAKFVEESGEAVGIGNDLKMKLHGLHKIVTEGSCREPQPMAFMLSARAKWNAWQRLGNMNPEEAMEQYLELLSNEVPKWMDHSSAGKSISGVLPRDSSSLDLLTTSNVKDLNSKAEGDEIDGASSLDSKAKDGK